MRCVSSSSSAPGRVLRLGALVFLLVAVLVAASTGGGGIAASQHAAIGSVAAYRDNVVLTATARRQLHASAWQGGTYQTSTGESVRVYVSEDYSDPTALGQSWADFLAALIHGSELALVTAYVLTPAEMDYFCGPHALGCYGGNELAFMGEKVSGVPPEAVAAHEYGHHIAANRQNPPWVAVDSGPKRWASHANICARAKQGSVFPGNEGEYYRLNPGEGFAEVYRVLSETKAGATAFTWSLVDSSFSPDATALQAAEADVREPWSAPATKVFRTRFTTKGRAIWTVPVATPLDGSLRVTLRFPRGSLHELSVLQADGRTVLGRGLWSSRTEKRLATTVCGQRTVLVRVTRRGSAGPLTLTVTHD